MYKILSITMLLALMACNTKTKEAPQMVNNKTFEPTWESLEQYQVPEWYLDMKFGIYFHWGPYSVPAHETEWYSIRMYQEGSPIRKYHEETYGDLKEFGYKDFIPMFTAEHFDADEWADLFVKAGAQFAGPVAEHADGFAMWDSELTEWDSKDMGPKIDVVGEMERAVKDRGLKFIATYHRHWLYAWYPTWDETTDAFDPKYEGLYGPKVPEGAFEMAEDEPKYLPEEGFNKEWLARLDELMNKYEPDIIWFDNKMNIIDEAYRKQFLANYYNKGVEMGRDVVCTYKFHDMKEGTAVLDLERSRMSEKKDFPWLTDDSIDWGAWCDVKITNYKSVNRLIDFLVDVVSKNGAVLLNITPRADGTIPDGVRERLLGMGEWLKVNGEAIYGARTWEIYGEGPAQVVEGHLSEFKNADNTEKDIRFTTNDGNLYALVMDWPTEATVIKALGNNSGKKVKSVSFLGSDEKITWEQTADGLVINAPRQKVGDYAFTYKIKLK